MGFDYQRAQATALRLIANFGTSMPLIRLNTEYDPVTGQNFNESIQISEATVVSLPASSGTVQAFDDRYLDDLKNGRIRFFYVAAAGLKFEPSPGDHFFFEGQTWDIAGATPLNPAGTPVLYTIGGRESGKGSFVDIMTDALNVANNSDLSVQELIAIINTVSNDHIRFSDLPILPNP